MITNITREQLLQALRDHPDWREETRAQILGAELMRLPADFQAFVGGQQKFNDEMQGFRQEALRRFDNIHRGLDQMENDSSWLKNFSTE